MKKDESIIPIGHYCYTRTEEKVIPCPYWRKIADKSPQQDGYCDFMELGDGDLHPTFKNGRNEPYEMWLLWDQIKGCGINFGDE